MSDIVTRARVFAVAAHAAVGQVRKYTGAPYWTHCEAVALAVWNATRDEEATAAAYLHDTIEDTKVTAEIIAGEFGQAVATLVLEVTDVSRPQDGNRATRKALDLRHLAEASPRGQTIKVADLIDNGATIVAHDPHFGRVYMGEKRALLQVLTRADAVLLTRAREILDAYDASTEGSPPPLAGR